MTTPNAVILGDKPGVTNRFDPEAIDCRSGWLSPPA
jgi:hypothetical protein